MTNTLIPTPELKLSEEQDGLRVALEGLEQSHDELLAERKKVKQFMDMDMDPNAWSELSPLRDATRYFIMSINELIASSGYPIILSQIDHKQAKEVSQGLNQLKTSLLNVKLAFQGVLGDKVLALNEAIELWGSTTAHNIFLFLEPLINKANILGLNKLSEDISKKLQVLESERKNRQAAQGSVVYADECEKAMESHRRFAWGTLAAFVIAVALTFRLVFWQSTSDGQLFFWIGPEAMKLPDSTDAWHFTAYALGKLILASFAVGLCVITCRVYLAHQHNIVSLRHQKLAAAALRDFFDTLPPEEKEARMNVVVQCVTAITAKEQSGFLKEDVKDYTAYTSALSKLYELGKK